MLQDGGDASFKEGKVHEADAAQVRFLLVLGDDLAESSDDILGSGSKGHNTLVFSGDRKVVQGKASKVTSITTLLSQAFGKGSENIVLSTAHHRNTVLLVADVAKLVDTLCGGSALFTLAGQHSLDQLRNVIKGWGLRRSTLWGNLCQET
jgi:hypothetical protein